MTKKLTETERIRRELKGHDKIRWIDGEREEASKELTKEEIIKIENRYQVTDEEKERAKWRAKVKRIANKIEIMKMRERSKQMRTQESLKRQIEAINASIREGNEAYLQTDLGKFRVESVDKDCWIYVEKDRRFLGTDNDLNKIAYQLMNGKERINLLHEILNNKKLTELVEIRTLLKSAKIIDYDQVEIINNIIDERI